jgi:4-hydroxy-2-oxoheptanedioate aldolase
MNRNNPIKTRILNREAQIGMFFKINSPSVAEMVGNAGFDFIIIDTEHGNFSPYEVENIIRAADVTGMNSVVRVRDASAEEILHALDSGADGVQIPSISSVEAARAACRSCKYFPEGNRGLSGTQRAAMFAAWPGPEDYYASANRNSLVVCHVENVEMADRVEELLDIPQIDVIFVGPGDLSQSMGKPGKLEDPEVTALIGRIFDRVLAKGKAAGIYCGGVESAKRYIGLGATYIALGSDINLLAGALRNLKGAVKGLGTA